MRTRPPGLELPPSDTGPGLFWTTAAADLFGRLDTSGEGLSEAEASERLKRFGRNEIAQPRSFRGFLQAFARIVNPLILILLAASVVSAFVGELVNAVVIALMVATSAAIDLYQTRRSEEASKQLRKRVESKATVRRGGSWTEVSATALAPGDRILLRGGDIVPADARLVAANALTVDEAAFTGESLPAEKSPGDGIASRRPADARNAVFMGTVVFSGSGEAVVANTGSNTTYGALARELERRVPPTAFDRGLTSFGLLIARTVTALVVFVLAVNLVANRPFIDSLLFAIALAVGMTPEFLPMIMSVTQAEGALKMAQSRVIVRQLASIQSFGNLDVICSDKTGTLTEGRMALDTWSDAFGTASERVLELAWLNSTLQAGIRSAFDDAIRERAKNEGFKPRAKLDEVPFDFERRRLSVSVEMDGRPFLICKGAPESVLSVCKALRSGDGLIPLDDAVLGRVNAHVEAIGEQGLRVLAVATKDAPAGKIALADEAGLVLEGFLGFVDPPKEGVREAIMALKEDGIRLIILTGDAEGVTRSVLTSLQVDWDQTVVSGEQVEAASETDLEAMVSRHTAFARLTPEDKPRVITALQRTGHVVGYIGDGINDAPGLRAADVGISVAGAVDIAREAADIVLLEKSLSVLHSGVVQGRKVFANVMKYIMMGTSSNFGNMLSMAAAVLVLPFLPLLPSQVLLNNALYDFAQISIPTDHVDEATVRRPRHWDMRFIRDFMLLFGPVSSLYDFLTFLVLMRVFNADEDFFHSGWFVESLATQTLVIFVIRTAGNPFKSRPSLPLTVTALAVVSIGAFLPGSPLGHTLGFVPLTPLFAAFVVVATATYLVLVQLLKRLFYRLHPLA